MKFFKIINFFILNLLNKPSSVGGQALIEGVMMRGKNKISAVLRRKDNSITQRTDHHKPYKEKSFVFGLFVIRGAVTFFESLAVGIKYLTYSADIAEEDEKGHKTSKTFKDNIFNVLSIVFAFVVGLGIFVYIPIFLTNFINKDLNPFVFNLTAGAIRIIFFLIYVFAISKMKDIQRVFEYHGAEHKSIFAYEAEDALTVENAKKYSTLHPRCGTSFIIIVAFLCILIFSIVDSVFTYFFGPYTSAFQRFGVHLFLLPIVSGMSYEILKFSDKYSQNPIMGKLILPGIWLQKITTKEPDNSQLEIGITSIKNVI